LMAYADHALDAHEHADMAARIAVDPALAKRLEAFVVTGKPLARVFDQVVEEPIPARLLAVFDQPLAVAPAASATVHPFKPRQAVAPRVASFDWQRMAAALVLGLGAGWLGHAGLSPSPGGSMIALENGQMVAHNTLQRALENNASGQKSAVDGGTVSVVFSFKNKDGGYCRQYHIDGGANRAVAGVACRDASGAWPVVVQAEAKPMIAAGKIAPAGEKNAALDTVVDRLIATDVMSVEDEAGAVRRSWRVQP
jgi:hypothetical protein